MLINIKSPDKQAINNRILQDKHIQMQVLRLDMLHPVVSGNKIYKLHYFFENIHNNTVVTFGGAYSNHLVATAYACKQNNINSIGIVRGEEPKELSFTLQQCLNYGMNLHFINRDEYNQKSTSVFKNELINSFGEFTLIPEGGYGQKGAEGAAEISNYIDDDTTHICCAAGTATTAAGLLLNIKPHQKLIVFPVLKGMNDIVQRINFLTEGKWNKEQLQIESNYHFGGYTKKTPELIYFMNYLYKEHQLPTDFVYTAKMMYGTMELINNNFFTAGSKICCVHTGGLQGNLSLPKNTLTF